MELIKFPKGNFKNADELYELILEGWIKEKEWKEEKEKLKKGDKEEYNKRHNEIKNLGKIISKKSDILAESIVGKKDVDKFLYNIGEAFKKADVDGLLEIKKKSDNKTFILISVLLLVIGGIILFFMIGNGEPEVQQNIKINVKPPIFQEKIINIKETDNLDF